VPLVPIAPAELVVVGAPMISPVLAAVAEVPITALPPAVDVATPHPDIEFAVVVIFPPAADEFLTWKIELNCAS